MHEMSRRQTIIGVLAEGKSSTAPMVQGVSRESPKSYLCKKQG
jgi:hypothetical protein